LKRTAVNRNILLLGLTSFFGDVASEMVVPLLPAFLVQLGGGASFIGLIEGSAEAVASLFKYLSGRIADRVPRLLPLAAAGYAISGLVRPLLAICAAPWQVLAIRCTDRVGKGVRTSPRDKLLTMSAPEGALAEAFSFHRGMDHLGAAVGPLGAAALLWAVPGDLRRVFLVASVFGLVALLSLLLVRERPAQPAPPKVVDATIDPASGAAPAGKARVPPALLAAIGLFTLGNSSDALLLLRAQSLGVPPAQLPLLWTVLHFVRAGLSWPLGRAADRLGRRAALACGWVWYALCYVGFALASSPGQVWVLFAAYGLVAGLTEGSERALISAAVPESRRGTALGLYNLISGVGLMIASVVAGLLWEKVSPTAALTLGAGCAVAAAIVLGVGSAARSPDPA
jgi:MFS family permease